MKKQIENFIITGKQLCPCTWESEKRASALRQGASKQDSHWRALATNISIAIAISQQSCSVCLSSIERLDQSLKTATHSDLLLLLLQSTLLEIEKWKRICDLTDKESGEKGKIVSSRGLKWAQMVVDKHTHTTQCVDHEVTGCARDTAKS